MKTPIVFISYSWDSDAHKDWVRKLADNLVENGVDIILDQYDLSVGNEMTHFMEKGLAADKILLIMTPNYKLKADDRKGGVGYEYSLFTKELYDSEPDKSRIYPILRTGDGETSCPLYIATRVFHDMRENNLYDAKLFELIRIIADKPWRVKPILGQLPDFDKTIPDIDKALLDYQQKESFVSKKNAIINSEKGTTIFLTEVNNAIGQITESIENYKRNFRFPIRAKVSHQGSIHLASFNFTFYLGREEVSTNSASNAKVVMNFFTGVVGFEDEGVWNEVKREPIYLTKYQFDLDENLTPIFRKVGSPGVILKTHDLASIAIREVVTNELKIMTDRLG